MFYIVGNIETNLRKNRFVRSRYNDATDTQPHNTNVTAVM